MPDLSALTRPFYVIRRISRRLWVRMALVALLALVSAVSSTWLAGLLPGDLTARIDQGAVARILEILTFSMPAFTMYSMSVIVAARQWGSSQSTPRAHHLMI